jgi:chromosome segregation ATPase
LDRAHRRVIDNLVGERNLLQKSVDREFQEKQEALRDAHKLDGLYQTARKDITYQSGCIHDLQEQIRKVGEERDKLKKDNAALRLNGQIEKTQAILHNIGVTQPKKPESAPKKTLDEELLKVIATLVKELDKPEPKKSGFDFQEAYENLAETHSEVVHLLHRVSNERDEALGRVTEATIKIRKPAA